MSFTGACLHCGEPMECAERGRPRLYCSESCRKKHKRQLAVNGGPEIRRVLLDQWRREFVAEAVAELGGLLDTHGIEAAKRAAKAARLAVADDRRWQEMRAILGTNEHGRRLAQLLDRRDPRVAQFLKECGI